MDYSYLKSGTDIRGYATDLGGHKTELTDEAIKDITLAFVVWCEQKTGIKASELKISVGHDSRITAERIKSTVISSLTSSGVTVYDCGLSSTPAMFMTTVKLSCNAAVQITASHHPFDRNGLKFFLPQGGLEGSDISEILALASSGEMVHTKTEGRVIAEDFMIAYAKGLCEKIISDVKKGDKPLSGLHIIVDAGNGAGGFYVERVLKPLGADTTGSQFLEPDGMFPNHIPNPENKQAMESICSAVKKSGADLGIIFDTDVDRAGAVDSDGNEINRNRLVALASYIALSGIEGGTVVTDSVTSDGLKSYIENELSGKHFRYKRGYKNVIDKAIELCGSGESCPLAIETSGHAALRENYFLDDGAYLVTKIIIELAKGMDIKKILKPLKQPVEEREVRFSIKTDDFRAYGNNVISELEKFVTGKEKYTIADDNREGIRVSTENGWFLLRLSVHDPVMPMNFESNAKGGIDKDIEGLKPFFESFDKLVAPADF